MTDKKKPGKPVLSVITNAEDAPPATDGREPPGPPAQGDGADPSQWPVQPLGVRGDRFYFLDATNQLRESKPNDFGRLGLIALFGSKNHELEALWPRYGKGGKVDGADYNAAASALMASAARKGVWVPFGHVRGSGSWLGDAGELIWHCGDAVRVGSHWRNPGMIGPHVYPADKPRARPWEKPCASGDGGPAQYVLSMLASWNWRRGALDSHLLLGWIGAAMIAGALDWRPVVWITGGRGTGKSTLQHALERLFAGALVAVSDASAAGVWQKLGHATLPVVLDEVEAEEDNRRTNVLVKLARQAASGGLVLRGGSDHGASEFTARSCFLFSSILMPGLLGQDRSRMAILELGNLGAEAPPDLEPRKMRDLGRQLMRRLADGWPRWRDTLAVYRAALGTVGHGARGADVFGTLLAVADLLLHDGETNADYVQELAEELKVATLAEADDDLGDDERCLQHLLTQAIPHDGGASKRPVGEWISRAVGVLPLEDDAEGGPSEEMKRAAEHILGRYGLKVAHENGERLFAVASSNAELGKLFAGTHWQGRSGTLGVWTQTLRRLPMARPAGKTVWFSGTSGKATFLPLDLVLARPDGSDLRRAPTAPRFDFRRPRDEE